MQANGNHDRWSSTVSPTLGDNRIVRPTQESLDAAVCREILTGEEFRRKAAERKREQEAYKLAAQRKGHKEMLLGKCVAVMPMLEYMDLVAKYGQDEVASPEFLKYFNREFSHLSPHKV